jgi:hypothetical protein
VDADHYWYLVKTVLGWPNATPVFATIQDLQTAHPELMETLQERGAQRLTLLWQRLCSDDVINFFSVHEQNLDDVVDIFVRVNSAGLPLSKTDLLFSTIVAHWEAGRTEIESCIAALNNKGNRFIFDNDFVMRCCLVLTDVPVRFKVESFKQENIERIRNGWENIKNALHETVELLVQWGFNGETLPTQNAIIPIVYFVYKGGDVANENAVWHKYLIRALLNQIYSSQTDRVISAFRDYLRKEHHDGEMKVFKLTDLPITLDSLMAIKLPGDKTLAIDAEDTDQILDYEKGPYTFMVLSLLYPQLRFDQVQFHQDHIHPRSRFNKQVLAKLVISEEKIAKWQDLRDRLPNLQLMEGAENENKRARPFDEWLDASSLDKAHFLITNHIPANISVSLKHFEEFYESRKSLLRDKIKAVLNP